MQRQCGQHKYSSTVERGGAAFWCLQAGRKFSNFRAKSANQKNAKNGSKWPKKFKNDFSQDGSIRPFSFVFFRKNSVHGVY